MVVGSGGQPSRSVGLGVDPVAAAVVEPGTFQTNRCTVHTPPSLSSFLPPSCHIAAK